MFEILSVKLLHGSLYKIKTNRIPENALECKPLRWRGFGRFG